MRRIRANRHYGGLEEKAVLIEKQEGAERTHGAGGRGWSQSVEAGLCAEKGERKVWRDRGRAAAVTGVCFLPSGPLNKS